MNQEFRRITLNSDSICGVCNGRLMQGEEALFSREFKKVICPREHVTNIYGEPGKSVSDKVRKVEQARRDSVESIPLIGKIIYMFMGKSKESKIWEKGAKGEVEVGKILEKIANENGYIVMHDRVIPGSKANLDHILITPKGVFLVDAKNYKGKIEIVNMAGSFSKPNFQLRVGGRDQGKLVEQVKNQKLRMADELRKRGLRCEVVGVLAFVDGQWPLLSKPLIINDVYINGKGLDTIVGGYQSFIEIDLNLVANFVALKFPAKNYY
jgi:hypothetical protein